MKWQIVCSTAEEWDELVESLSAMRNPSVRKLHRALEVSSTYTTSRRPHCINCAMYMYPLVLAHFLSCFFSVQELLPQVQWLLHEREKEMKRKLIAELPRRMSDRIALKAQREEQVCLPLVL